jgi:hypothetical protein
MRLGRLGRLATRIAPRTAAPQWLALALLAVSGQSAQAPPAQRELPPLQPIAGLGGFLSVSRVVYCEAPDRPHELIATFEFPERARLWLGTGEGAGLERVLFYRSGERCYGIGTGTAASNEFAGEERATLLRQLELRRAWMLWPDGFAWQGDAASKRATLAELGGLEANLGPDGLPRSIASFDAAHREVERFDSLTWRAQRGRSFPATATLCFEGKSVWKEQVQSVETSIHYLDWFFLPPDRRPSERAAAGLAQLGRPEHIDLPVAHVRRRELAPKLFERGGWPAVLAEGERLLAAARGELEPSHLAPADQLAFELDLAGAPTHCLLRLKTPPEQPLEGWSPQLSGPAISLALTKPEQVTASVLRELAKLLPDGAAAGAAYLKTGLRTAGGASGVQVVLPVLGK